MQHHLVSQTKQIASNDVIDAHIDSRNAKIEELADNRVNGLYSMFLKDQTAQNQVDELRL